MRNKTKWGPLSEGLERAKNILIHAKFEQFNENNKCINQSTSNWTFMQHKRGFTKLLKGTNRRFQPGFHTIVPIVPIGSKMF